MTYDVARKAGWDVDPRYVVRRVARDGKTRHVVKAFHADLVETDHEVRTRAEAFRSRLDAGGVSRERALREAQARGEGRR